MLIINHAAASASFIANEPNTDGHNETPWFVHEKRDNAANQLLYWKHLTNLAEHASHIKDQTLSNWMHI